jgi:hypothetical protein
MRQRGKAAEGEEEDATPDLLLKHPDATVTKYVRREMKHFKHTSETLVSEKTLKTTIKHTQHPHKH